MDEHPLVSVVLNTYNRADLLPQSVDSVLAQNYPNFEVIIVDDCSQDNTPEVVATIVAEHGDRVRSIRLSENRGLAAARNAGIRAARGPLIAFQDDDDLWLPGKLTAQVKALRKHPECALCYGKALVATPAGELTDEVYGGSGRGRTGDIFELMLRHHVVLGPTLLVSNTVFDDVGYFDETMRIGEDSDMFLRMTMHHQAVYLPQPVTAVRQHEGRMTGTAPSQLGLSVKKKTFERFWRILPDSREDVRGLIAAGLISERINTLKCEHGDRISDRLLAELIEQHGEWLDYFEPLWHVADYLISDRNDTESIQWFASLLEIRAQDIGTGKRRAITFLWAAIRRGVRLRAPLLTLIGWTLRAQWLSLQLAINRTRQLLGATPKS